MRRILSYFSFIFILCLFSVRVNALSTDWSVYDHSKLRIISSVDSIKNQKEIFIGLHFVLKPGWKIYWLYPGDSGAPPKILFNKLKGAKFSRTYWPFPSQLIENTNLVTRVYYKEVVIPISLKLDKTKTSVEILANVSYQICKDICIPVETSFSLNIPEGKGNLSNYAQIIEKYKSKVPINADLLDIKKKNIIYKNKDEIIVYVESDNILPKGKVVALINSPENITYQSDKYRFSNDRKSVEIQVKTQQIDENYEKKKNNNIEVFVRIGELSFFWIGISEYIKNQEKASKLLLFFTAFIGGIILNFMPCVLPVLGIKVTNFLNQINSSRHTVVRSCLSITLGIIFTFLLFSLFSISMKYFGMQLGWGMQFQQPIFLVFIIIILVFFSLNIFGVYNIYIPSTLSEIFNKRLKYNIDSSIIKDFLSGVIATLLATPCTAPFVGTAVSFALTGTVITNLLAFFLMGLGMSVPYLIIIFNPSIIKYLPKPGVWMQYLKYSLGALLILTAIWVADILFTHVDTKREESSDKYWIKFNAEKIEEYIIKNKLVLVDITAKWCVTCKINKSMVLDNKEVLNYLLKNNVILMRGDWTLPNEEILKYLNRFDRAGIPFTVIYSKNFINGSPFPEILSKKKFVRKVEKAFSMH